MRVYLMFYRQSPLIFCAFLGVVSFLVTLLMTISAQSLGIIDDLILVQIFSCLFLAISTLLWASLAAKKNITMPVNELSEGRPYNLFEVLVLEEDKRVILDGPVWGRGQVYLIKKPAEIWDENKKLKVKTCLSIKHLCITVTIPVTLTFELDGPMHQLEVFDALYESQFSQDLDIEKYLAEAFRKVNLDNQDSFSELVEYCFEEVISLGELLRVITSSLILPKEALSNTKSIEVVLEEPIFSSSRKETF